MPGQPATRPAGRLRAHSGRTRCNRTHVFKLACLAASLSAGSSAAALLGPIQTWSLPSSTNHSRIWGEALLNSSILHPGSIPHVQHFFGKLNAGKAIRVTAIGSSLIQDFAGCFQPSVDALWSYPGVVPNPNIYPSQGVDTAGVCDLADERCRGGFMTTVMTTLNTTWPHKDNIFFNNGKGGASLGTISLAGCISAHLPEDIDLVILDTVTNLGPLDGAEVLIRSFLRRKSMPLIILLSNGRACLDRSWVVCVDDCMRPLAKGFANATRVCTHDEFKMMYSEAEATRWDSEAIHPYQELALHYNVAHLSTNELLRKLMNGPVVPEAGGQAPSQAQYPPGNDTLTRIRFISEFMADGVHLRKDRLGVLLTSDMITHYLASSQRWLQLPAQEVTRRLPDTTLMKGSRAVYVQRCYGSSLKDALETLNNSTHTDSKEKEQIAQEISRIVPGDHFAGFVTGSALGSGSAHEAETWRLNAQRSFPPLKIISQDGWAPQVAYRNPRGELKVKPGWLATTPGAQLVFEVDTEWPDITAVGQPQVLITYVQSYAGWGKVQMSCINCMCNSTTVDAHWEKKASLNNLAILTVTQHKQCRIMLTTLASTSTGGHKWKMVDVLARLEEAMTPGTSQPA